MMLSDTHSNNLHLSGTRTRTSGGRDVTVTVAPKDYTAGGSRPSTGPTPKHSTSPTHSDAETRRWRVQLFINKQTGFFTNQRVKPHNRSEGSDQNITPAPAAETDSVNGSSLFRFQTLGILMAYRRTIFPLILFFFHLSSSLLSPAHPSLRSFVLTRTGHKRSSEAV